jgi:NAD(P)H dehydrogenase (quinone)
MNIFIVHAHHEPKSFNGALTNVAQKVLTSLGHEVKISDLHAMKFDPVSDRRNFTSVKNPDYLKQQAEEMHASEVNGFAADIQGEIEKVKWCELMIWQFPLWWFSVPAILKGWVDRVFAMGQAYGQGRAYEKGVFRGKRAMLSITTGGVAEAFTEKRDPLHEFGEGHGFHGDIYGVLRPIQRGILSFTGFAVMRPHIVHAPVRLTDEERRQCLDRYAKRLRGIADELPIDVGLY